LIAGLAACSGGSMGPIPSGGSNAQSPAAALPAVARVQRSCATATRPNEATCFAIFRTDVPTHIVGYQRHSTPSGYGPSSLQSAYKLPSSTAGSGQTVAIVDAYDDPTAANDLSVYRAQYGLPACTTTSGCFKKVSQTGSTTSLPSKNGGWAQEESLDIDMVSAICPNCHIILVEAKSATNANLATAVNEAIKLGANVVSNSYGGSETGASNSSYNHPGHIITASAGDSGTGASQPCSYSTVVCVGGTSLSTASNTRGWSETAWSGSGSGCSADVSKPSWQTDTGCKNRSEADASAVADPNTGVSVYDSTRSGGYSGWMVFGGTSVSSPLIAAVYALAGNASSLNYASSIWAAGGGSSLNDVTSGSNGSCSISYICNAGAGYDGPTGWGTPNGIGAF
jgi:subtilase family serine protease